jgi:hypothetical protein
MSRYKPMDRLTALEIEAGRLLMAIVIEHMVEARSKLVEGSIEWWLEYWRQSRFIRRTW